MKIRKKTPFLSFMKKTMFSHDATRKTRTTCTVSTLTLTAALSQKFKSFQLIISKAFLANWSQRCQLTSL